METEKIFAANLTELRKSKQWTQLELAEKLNYSDKTISKWERGDGLPDLKTTCALAELFGVTVDFFVTDGAAKTLSKYAAPKKENGYRIGISLLAVIGVWFAVTIAYVYFFIYDNVSVWTLFIWGIPISALILLYFNSKWGKAKYEIFILSLLCWSFITSVYLQILVTRGYNMWALFFIGIPMQFAIILWHFIKSRYR